MKTLYLIMSLLARFPCTDGESAEGIASKLDHYWQKYPNTFVEAIRQEEKQFSYRNDSCARNARKSYSNNTIANLTGELIASQEGLDTQSSDRACKMMKNPKNKDVLAFLSWTCNK